MNTRSVANPQTRDERLYWVDHLRALSCAAVVLLHVWAGVINTKSTYENGGAVAIVGAGRLLQWLFFQTTLTRFAVPCFLMITGFLLLGRPENVECSRVGHYTPKAVLALLLFALPYCVIERYVGAREVSLQLVCDSVYAFLCGNSWNHMWYVYTLLGIYLILPVLSCVVQHTHRETQVFILAVLAVATLVVPTLNGLLGTEFDALVPVNGSSVFYVFLGGYLRRFGVIDDARCFVVGLGCLLSTIIFQSVFVLLLDELPNDLTSPTSPLVAGYSLAVFLLSVRLLNVRPSRFVSSLARNSFGIYLLHPVPLNALYKGLGVSPLNTPYGSTIAFFLLALAVSWFATAVLRRMPVFKVFL